MARQMIVLVKGPKGQRGWLVAADDDDKLGALAYFVKEDPAQPYQALREYLQLKPDEGLPTQIEVQVSQVYFRRLAGQVFWR